MPYTERMIGGERMSYSRITVPLSREELNALREAADRDFRHPRDQARYLVRQALGLVDKPPSAQKTHGAARVAELGSGAGVNVQG